MYKEQDIKQKPALGLRGSEQLSAISPLQRAAHRCGMRRAVSFSVFIFIPQVLKQR